MLLILAVQAAAAAPAAAPAITRPPLLGVVRPCTPDADPETVTVCGKRRNFRLPLPVERDGADAYSRAPGDLPSAAAALDSDARCGIFAGERRCGRREAALYGYGGGRDPITVLTRLGAALLDPE